LETPSRILIIRPSALGDVVRTVPALVSLRRAFPDARISWLVADQFAPAIANHPDLSAVVPFPRRQIGTWLRQGAFGELVDWVQKTLRDPSYDLVIDFQGLFRSGFLTLATWASTRIGLADARELGWLGYTRRVNVVGGFRAHHVERVRALVEAAGATWVENLRLYPNRAEEQLWATDPDLGGRRYVLLAPTTRGLGRMWPTERYAAVASQLLSRRRDLGIDAVAVVGLESERKLCGPLLAVDGVVDRVGATGISGLMTLIEHAALVLCNDSAAMHMAVAFRRPLVALLGPTDIGHAGPYKRKADVITHRRRGERVRHRDVQRASELMRRIEVDEVMKACEERLAVSERC
jgi:ADP-heptose:LPS heptosyltransferase